MMKIGPHVSITGGLPGAAHEALSYGANAFMIYTGAPQNTVRKPIKKLLIDEGRRFMTETGLSIDNVVVHAPYIVNLASSSPDISTFSRGFMRLEMERCDAIGAPFIVAHPGSNPNRTEGLAAVAESLNDIISESQNVRICLETMSGRGSELGRTFDELAAIIENVRLNDRILVCLDTCHVFDAGYDIVSDFEGVMRNFDDVLGIWRLHVVHLNGSLNPLGSRKDRHANIGSDGKTGKGPDFIGFKTLYNIAHSDILEGRIFILETPRLPDGSNLYKEEIAMLRPDRGAFW